MLGRTKACTWKVSFSIFTKKKKKISKGVQIYHYFKFDYYLEINYKFVGQNLNLGPVHDFC